MHNHKSIVAGIKNLLKTNYGYAGDEVDVDALVDDTLTFQENWNRVKRKYVEMKGDITDE